MRRRTDRQLGGMVVAITGASAGIGRALAEELSARGARLVLAARRTHRLERLNRSLGGVHLCVAADVAAPADCHALIARAVEHFGRIDTLVCNAGYGIIRPAADTSAHEWQRIFATNVLGTTECVRAAVPLMRRQEPRDGWRGQVVVVTSAVARRALPYFGAYCATKSAQLALAEAQRVELAGDRIAVTSVLPVGTATEFFRSAIRLSGAVPPRRSAIEVRQTPARVASAIVAGIRRPRPEVWPSAPYRLLLSLATLLPGVADRFLGLRLRGRTDDRNGAEGQVPDFVGATPASHGHPRRAL